jgi:hypothetical protein
MEQTTVFGLVALAGVIVLGVLCWFAQPAYWAAVHTAQEMCCTVVGMVMGAKMTAYRSPGGSS